MSNENSDYLRKNKALWNERTLHHIDSEFYDVPSFVSGKNSLKEPELELLGNPEGKTVLHLQCHFGQDSISLARMGASVTAIDFSEEAIRAGTKLAETTGTKVRFICCDVYSLPEILDEKFDIVFTSYGTIGWLPDLSKWSAVIAHFMKPGGRFVFAEFHPVVWMFDADFTKPVYTYLKSDPIIETISGTYTNHDADIARESVGWNHGLSEVISSLLAAGMVLNSFREFDYSPYNCFSNMISAGEGRFRIKGLDNYLPLMYTLSATMQA